MCLGCHARQDGGEVGVVEGGGEAFGGDAALARRVPAQGIAGERADEISAICGSYSLYAGRGMVSGGKNASHPAPRVITHFLMIYAAVGSDSFIAGWLFAMARAPL